MTMADIFLDLHQDFADRSYKACWEGLDAKHDACYEVAAVFADLYDKARGLCGHCRRPLNKNNPRSCYYTQCQWGLPERAYYHRCGELEHYPCNDSGYCNRCDPPEIDLFDLTSVTPEEAYN